MPMPSALLSILLTWPVTGAGDYEPWVRGRCWRLKYGPGKNWLAWNSALIDEMIYTHPVLYEILRKKNKTERSPAPFSIINYADKDNTASSARISAAGIFAHIGKHAGTCQACGRTHTCETGLNVPNCSQAPQIQDPARFHQRFIRA